MQHDVLIVGAGLAGCSVASRIAAQRSVLLLDQGAPGAEASAQNAGMVRRMGEDPYERALALRTHDWMCDPGEGWADLAPSRRTGAVLALAHDDHHLHDAAAHLRASGAQISTWTGDPGAIAPGLAGARLRTVWHLPDERVADAWSLISGFLQIARRHGAGVRPDTPVRALIREGDRVIGVRTDHEELHADAVVLAAGAWSGRLASDVGLRRPLIPLRRALLQTEPDPRSDGHPWCWIDDVGVYVRPEAGGWMVSGCDEAVSWPSGPGSRGPLEDVPRALAAAKLERWLPALAGARFRGGWSGLRTFAPDRRPVLGADPAAPGLWWAAGLGGFGVSCSYAVGDAVGSWLLGEDVPWLGRAPVSPGRLQYGRWLIRPDGDLAHATMESV